jgi:Fur family peroxide stress response transcriptional regulator
MKKLFFPLTILIIVIIIELMRDVNTTISQSRKRSKKRDAILGLIRSTTVHPSAQWVFNALKPSIPDLSLATVYRNLNLFREEGLVDSLGVVAGEERFDGETAPHPHFVCRRCGKVEDIPCPSVETLRRIAGESDSPPGDGAFAIDYRRTVFSGLCGECRKATNPLPNPGEEAVEETTA